MTIRMRNNHGVTEDQVYAEHGPEYGWSRRGERDGMKIFFTTADWEPLPTDRWQDVTGECEIYQEMICNGGGDDLFVPTNNASKLGYRLRKVQVDAVPYTVNDGPTRYITHWAFLVERKVSE